MNDLFQTIDKIYTARDVSFVNELDTSVQSVPINLLLSRNFRNSHLVKYLNKYVFVLDTKEFAALAWSMIQPKLSKAPFVGKIAKVEEASRYDFLLEKIKKRLEIGENDWKMCKDAYLQHIKENTVDYLVFYGCKRKQWNELGYDFEESKNIKTTDIVEGLDKWFGGD